MIALSATDPPASGAKPPTGAAGPATAAVTVLAGGLAWPVSSAVMDTLQLCAVAYLSLESANVAVSAQARGAGSGVLVTYTFSARTAGAAASEARRFTALLPTSPSSGWGRFLFQSGAPQVTSMSLVPATRRALQGSLPKVRAGHGQH